MNLSREVSYIHLVRYTSTKSQGMEERRGPMTSYIVVQIISKRGYKNKHIFTSKAVFNLEILAR